MAVMMVITLYTSRVVLDVLGVDDFGIYSIVGGVVVSMQFISNTLASSLQRFLSYELGLGENGTPPVSMITSISSTISSSLLGFSTTIS